MSSSVLKSATICIALLGCGAPDKGSMLLDAPDMRYEKAEAPTLADTGLYAPGTLEPAPGVMAYAPRFPLYSDALGKRRYVLLPEAPINGERTEFWQFPVGTRLWKEFYLEDTGRLIETRYMEKTETGWLFGTYVWNEEQTAATLWSGAAIPNAAVVRVPGPSGPITVDYTIPSLQDCLSCHVQRGVGPDPDPVLGFQAVQLPASTLRELQESDRLVGFDVSPAAHAIPARSSIERNVIGYLHGNCGHCHNPQRTGVVRPIGDSLFALNYNLASVSTWRDINLMQLVNRPVIDGSVVIPGVPGSAQVIVPGRPEHSMLYHRMAVAQGVPKMPRIGNASRDHRAITGLVRPWIQTLPPERP